MARQIIQIIHCDGCNDVIEDEDDVIEMFVSIGRTEYALEVDEKCDDYRKWTLNDVIEKGHVQQTSSKRSHKRKTPTSPPVQEGELRCKKCGRTDFTSQQGLSMHKTRADHWLPDEPRPTAADRKKSYRARQQKDAVLVP